MFFHNNKKNNIKASNNCISQTPENSVRLENVLNLIRNLAKSGNVREHQVIFYIVKMYSDKINICHNTNAIEKSGENNENDLEQYVTLQSFLPSIEGKIVTLNDYGINEFNIELGKFPVISKVWDSARLIDSLKNIGMYENQKKWNEDTFNHLYTLILPIGVTFILNGFHSANCGIIKAEGTLNITKNSVNAELLDISTLYDKFWFDGDFYRRKNDNSVVYKPIFESGCLFEIGRILYEHNISFFKVFSLNNLADS